MKMRETSRAQDKELAVNNKLYMADADFDAVMAIAGEREDISIIISSTPTGRRGKFYMACTQEDMHFHEHYHPSMHNPNWSVKMEAEFRAMLSEQGYVHEILAEFGTQATGVFNKDKIDAACDFSYYSYRKLDYYQEERAKIHFEECGEKVQMMMYDKNNKPVAQPFRTFGIDWDENSKYLKITLSHLTGMSSKEQSELREKAYGLVTVQRANDLLHTQDNA